MPSTYNATLPSAFGTAALKSPRTVIAHVVLFLLANRITADATDMVSAVPPST